MKIFMVSILIFVGSVLHAADTSYSLECNYYSKNDLGKSIGGSYETTFTPKGFSSNIRFDNVLDITSQDGNYRFSIIQGDEGTQFLKVLNIKNKNTALSSLVFEAELPESGYMSTILSETDFDHSSGFMGGNAGIQCEVSKLKK